MDYDCLIVGILQTKQTLSLVQVLFWCTYLTFSPLVSGMISQLRIWCQAVPPDFTSGFTLHYQMTPADWNVTEYQAREKQKGKVHKSAQGL